MAGDDAEASGQHAPRLFSAFTHQILSSEIDYNGHLHDAAYATVVSDANEVVLEALGMSAAYRATGRSLYTVEMTIRFLREVRLDDVLQAETRLAAHDTKRVRLATTLRDQEGRDVATSDVLYLHVDTELGRVVEFPPDRMADLDRVQALHDAVTART